jgi:C1A family cysteine protease
LCVAIPTLDHEFSDAAAEEMFNAWTVQHNKEYTPSEIPARFAAFRKNLNFVARHNAEHANGLQTYNVELNRFADMTQAEFKAFYLGYTHNENRARNFGAINGTAPAAVDWRQKGAVTPVKNQGQCGSCWSFSATGALEGANFLKTGKLVALSEQQFLDCDTVDSACNGGLMDNAFDYVQKNGGVDSEDDYKYLARQTIFDKCPKSKTDKHVGTCSSHTDVPASDESQLQLAVAQQPVSVAIEADQPGFQMYKSGVFTGACGTTLDHGVLAVGYGTEGSQDYWIVKNSWGAAWGEQGYIRFARNTADKAGQCGIAMAASYPTA